MATSTQPCIYCSTPVDVTRGEGDHVVPAAIGKFRDDLRFYQICPKCNRIIGAHEEQLLRCAPESLVLRSLKPATDRRGRGTRKWVGAGGLPPPQVVHMRSDHKEAVKYDVSKGGFVEKFDHLDLIPKTGQPKFLQLVPKMTGTQLRTKVKDFGFGPLKEMRLHCEGSRWDHYQRVVLEAWPGCKIVEGEPTEVGFQRVLVRHEFRVGKPYWQAIAKIAFHYFLVTSGRGYTGAEKDFRDLRAFIRDGVGANEFFFRHGLGRQRTPEAISDPAGIRLDDWHHLLMMDESGPHAQVGVHLFIGPDRQATTAHLLTFPAFRSRLVAPGFRRAHLYMYFPAADQHGYAGIVREVPWS